MKAVATTNINTQEYWDRRYREEADEMWNIWKTGDLVNRIADHIPFGSHVLDVGSGAGIIPVRVSQLRHDIVWSVCDFSPESVCYLRELHGIEFDRVFLGDVEKGLLCKDSSHPVVTCIEVLEHLSHPTAAVQELCRIAKFLVITTVPNENIIASKEHVWSFSANDMDRLFSPYGTVHTELVRDKKHILTVCTLQKDA